MNDPAVRMAALRTRFLQKCSDERVALVAVWDQGDMLQLKAIAHRLAGSAGIFGANALGQAALQLEQVLDQGAGTEAIETAYIALERQLAVAL